MEHHLRRLTERCDVTAVSNFDPVDLAAPWIEGVRRVRIPIARPIRPVDDICALCELYRLFRRERFDLVQSVTPKAGLLAMTAGALAHVPRRAHWFTGQVWATRRGMVRLVLKTADRVIVRMATHVLADSHSQRDFLERERVVPAGKVKVLGQGSISGVDPDRFRPDPEQRSRLRAELGIPADAILLLFVGRLNRDKGVLDLADAFVGATARNPALWLAVVGPDEAGLEKELLRRCGTAATRVRRLAYTPQPECWMAAADLFVLPSYREGFGSVVIEAAACGIPAVVSRVYGLIDAVEEGVTGLLHQPGNVAELRAWIDRLCTDSGLRQKLGHRARERALRNFSMEAVTSELFTWYEKIGLFAFPPARSNVLSLPRSWTAGCQDREPGTHLQTNTRNQDRRGVMASVLKRLLDLMCALAGLLLLLPLLASVGALVRLCMGSPVLFRQARAGRGGQTFVLLKFRTMRDARGSDGRPLPDRARLTRLGRFLRRTSLDELPQLWNVLQGDMSLIGPRPLPPEYLPFFTERERRRFEVRPGITGWAQIHGRNLASWNERLERDAWYVEHYTLLLDFRILLSSLLVVFLQQGMVEDQQSVVAKLSDERQAQTPIIGVVATSPTPVCDPARPGTWSRFSGKR